MELMDTPNTAPSREEHNIDCGVYVDDYVLALVDSDDWTLLWGVSQAMLRAIRSIFPPPEASGHIRSKVPILSKKLGEIDACFNLDKEILLFMIHGVNCIICLSEAKVVAVKKNIVAVLRKKHDSLKCFRLLLGKLQQHAAQIIPTTKGMFSSLNEATTRGDPKESRLGKTSEVRAALLDLKHAPKLARVWLWATTSNRLCGHWNGQQRWLLCTANKVCSQTQT